MKKNTFNMKLYNELKNVKSRYDFADIAKAEIWFAREEHRRIPYAEIGAALLDRHNAKSAESLARFIYGDPDVMA